MTTLRLLTVRTCLPLLVAFCLLDCVQAEVRVHHVFDNNMVVQREKPVRVWGWADAGEAVTVQFAGQTKAAAAGADRTWSVDLDPLEACDEGRVLTVKGKANTVKYENVLVGDVWVLGGQSNMEDTISYVYHGDVEVASANLPAIRLLTIPVGATPKPQTDFPRIDEFNAWTNQTEKKGSWAVCSPETVHRFSAIGYVFGRRLHLAGKVPIGLIDASVGGTTAEAWTTRATLAAMSEAAPLLAEWDERIAAWDPKKDLQGRIERWEKETEKRKAEGRELQPKPDDLRPGPAFDRNNPGASYNGMIAPFAGFSVTGAIFNQGYNNALGDARPSLYAKTFQAMIRDWRGAFRDENMPFGIVELTAGGAPQTLENFELRMLDAAPFVREAQFKAYRELPHVGFACAYDQQVPWYHPHKKVQLGERIARWALATRYDVELGWEPAICTDAKSEGDRMVLTFDRVVQTHDGRPIAGFAVAGEDKQFVPARVRYAVVGKDDRGRDREDRKILEVYSELVEQPVAVRYAWARNPLGNLVNGQHHERILPVPSFRTDNWNWPEAGFGPDARGESGRVRGEMRKQAEEHNRQRRLRAAKLLVEQLQAE
ncbi:MAG: hypothetical protein HQ567_29740 [Candidatus Nealsonbacteria bacterium]|nr:hypothetical protein [Candidatus Nealsonbacteria bacterium]